jgi:uncharacterized repeat protein (TIGR03847 family)
MNHMSPQFMALSHVDFITVGAEGPPDRRTFYLQAAQGDLLLSLVIGKEHAMALSLGIHQVLTNLGGIPADELMPLNMELRQPIRPLFQVAKLGLGYDEEKDALLIVAQARTVGEESDQAPEVHLWGRPAQMFALANQAAAVATAERPQCPLCHDWLAPDERHVCSRGNGRKWLYQVSE